ncbi:WXG100 family type VII secretion target [Streptomyces sp. 6N223]|uniref:WXG100 family type VII secretion target n=1 Tax=Streptomyces sp. 6N223 TaxID=3457412 RepID=UPI003FD3E14B
MSVDRGADITRLRELATKFGEKAETLRTEIIEALGSACDESMDYWKGPGADRFRQEYAEAKPTFTDFATALDNAKESANNSAENIEAATA